MGRKRKDLTPEEIQERKQRWWGEERNARRRLRYRQDSEYRKKTVQQVRFGYKARAEASGTGSKISIQPVAADTLPCIGRPRLLEGEERTVALTFTVAEVARAVGRDQQVIYRWLKAGLLPPSKFEALSDRNRWQGVYTLTEMLCIRDELAAHFQRSVYYKPSHTETRDRLFRAIEALRANPDPD